MSTLPRLALSWTPPPRSSLVVARATSTTPPVFGNTIEVPFAVAGAMADAEIFFGSSSASVVLPPDAGSLNADALVAGRSRAATHATAAASPRPRPRLRDAPAVFDCICPMRGRDHYRVMGARVAVGSAPPTKRGGPKAAPFTLWAV